ncbi:putative cation transporter [Thermoanaerobacter kivui]|uniref:Putative cation transporter n=1 Tax=Thermoanaerobacter kivui TaxID=2325 RepID=A0A097ANN3_THEKI|nr:DUF1646 family protein [Thermoanaerobacter kivui]AIS51418.1 putative cation transporter [Thermoanaerobacter kivui]
MVIVALLVILLMILILPLANRHIEHNIEYFLFAMGVAAAFVSGVFSYDLIEHIFKNHLLYLITAAVFLSGLLFEIFKDKFKKSIGTVVTHIPLKIFIFLIIIILGLTASIITAIIASIILVEIIHLLPLKHKDKVVITVIASLSIGMGAALTPIGEPLATIVTSKLNANFFYLFNTLGIYVIPGILALGFLGLLYINKLEINNHFIIEENYVKEAEEIKKVERFQFIFIQAFKIFVFILALELLGAGFKPIIDNYIIHLDSRLLYWINMASAVLDNATLAAAEISPAMTTEQIQAILMGLLISGGMLIPGNIPNIISAGKLNIKSREWALVGIPLSLVGLVIYFIIHFVI